MARVSDLPPWLRAVVKTYPWRRIDPVPVAPIRTPLSDSRVALVTTAGLDPPGEAPFGQRVRGGDVSYRVIPGDAHVRTLTEHHRSDSFDHAGILEDPNLAFPLDRLRELAARGEIGEVAPRHLSFMGSITAPGRLRSRTAPEAAGLLAQDRPDKTRRAGEGSRVAGGPCRVRGDLSALAGGRPRGRGAPGPRRAHGGGCAPSGRAFASPGRAPFTSCSSGPWSWRGEAVETHNEAHNGAWND